MRYSLTTTAASGSFPEDSKTNVHEWARGEILKRTTKINKLPFFYKDCLRFVIGKLGTFSYMDSEGKILPIRCIHANPERAIAKLEQEANILLPIISISQDSSESDEKRRRQKNILISTSWWSEKKKRAFRVLSIAPQAVNIQYGINIWTKYKSDMDQIVEQIRLLFNPALIVESSQTTTASAFIVTETDNSDFDLEDREDRVIRKTFNISLEGYIPNPKFLLTSTGEIEEFGVDSEIY